MIEMLQSLFSKFTGGATATPAKAPLAITTEGPVPLAEIQPGMRGFHPIWTDLDPSLEVHAGPIEPGPDTSGPTLELLGMVLPQGIEIATPAGTWIPLASLKVGDEIQGWTVGEGASCGVVIETVPTPGAECAGPSVKGAVLIGPEGGPYIAARI